MKRLLTTLLLLTACSRAAAPPPRIPPPVVLLPMDSALWVDSLMRSMTLEQKVGQMIMGRLEGDFDNMGGAQISTAIRQIQELGIGGYSVGVGSPAEFALKTNALQRRAALPLWFAADLEWGSAMRLWRPTYLPYGIEGGGGTAFPFNMGIGATGEPSFAETAGLITAREARAVGIHWLFAPVADVNTAPGNPIVNVRSYGSDARDVSRFISAYVRGARSGGALTAAKHFPGHGDTDVDSHVSLPVLQVTRERLDSVELRPFRAAVEAGASGIMTGHLAVPAITGNRDVPTSVAPQTASLIRDDLRFTGLVVTDAMTMGALRRLPGYSPAEIAVRAVEAGADVVLSPPDIAAAHSGIVAAVNSGRLTSQRIDQSVHRILSAKAWLKLHREREVDLDSVNVVVANAEHERRAAEIAARSMTLARDPGNLLPLDPRAHRSVALIAFSAVNDIGAGRTLAAQLRRSYEQVSFTRLDESIALASYDSAVAQAARADAVILATFLMPISGQGHIAVPRGASVVAQRIAETGKKVITVSFGDPYGPAQLPTAGTYLLAWQPRSDHAQIAAARAIAGLREITGVLPIDLPGGTAAALSRGSSVRRPAVNYRVERGGAESVGMSSAGLARVDSIIEAALANGAAPGAALAIGRHGRLVRLRGFGKLDYRPNFGAVTDSSIWDLASLTKVVGTTSAAMMVVEDGLLDLDAPVKQYLPEWGGSAAKDAVTVRQLLTHTAGLPAFKPFWSAARGREQFLAAIAALPLEYAPGSRMIYSDIGLITTGLIVERITGKGLDEFLHDRLFEPLGLRETMFNPLAQSIALAATGSGSAPARCCAPRSELLPRIAPTEIDTLFRKQHMHGRVHDENAFAIGGVSGHAGLFSSARDLAAFAQMMLNHGFYNGRRVLNGATIDQFRTRQNDFSSRALGWDTPAPCGLGTAGGDYFSAQSIGHTGFTGTSLWIDFERDLFVILLTNRVNPTRDNQKHVPLRRAVHDAVQKALIDSPVEPREWVANARLRNC